MEGQSDPASRVHVLSPQLFIHLRLDRSLHVNCYRVDCGLPFDVQSMIWQTIFRYGSSRCGPIYFNPVMIDTDEMVRQYAYKRRSIPSSFFSKTSSTTPTAAKHPTFSKISITMTDSSISNLQSRFDDVDFVARLNDVLDTIRERGAAVTAPLLNIYDACRPEYEATIPNAVQ